MYKPHVSVVNTVEVSFLLTQLFGAVFLVGGQPPTKSFRNWDYCRPGDSLFSRAWSPLYPESKTGKSHTYFLTV